MKKLKIKIKKDFNFSQLSEDIQKTMGWTHYHDSPDKKGYDGINYDHKENELVVIFTDDGENPLEKDLTNAEVRQITDLIQNQNTIPDDEWNEVKMVERLKAKGLTDQQVDNLYDAGLISRKQMLKRKGFTNEQIKILKDERII